MFCFFTHSYSLNIDLQTFLIFPWVVFFSAGVLRPKHNYKRCIFGCRDGFMIFKKCWPVHFTLYLHTSPLHQTTPPLPVPHNTLRCAFLTVCALIIILSSFVSRYTIQKLRFIMACILWVWTPLSFIRIIVCLFVYLFIQIRWLKKSSLCRVSINTSQSRSSRSSWYHTRNVRTNMQFDYTTNNKHLRV